MYDVPFEWSVKCDVLGRNFFKLQIDPISLIYFKLEYILTDTLHG